MVKNIRGKFRIRSGPRGRRITIVGGRSIVSVKKTFKRKHPRTEIDSVEFLR